MAKKNSPKFRIQFDDNGQAIKVLGLRTVSKHQASKKKFVHVHNLSRGELNTNLRNLGIWANTPASKKLRKLQDFENLPEYSEDDNISPAE